MAFASQDCGYYLQRKEYRSGQRMEVDQVFPPVEIDLWNTQKSMPSQGDLNDKLICIQSVPQVSTVYIIIS